MASRKEEKRRLREEREARAREAAAEARRRQLVGYGTGGALALAAVVAIVAVAVTGAGEGSGGGSEDGQVEPSAASFPEAPAPPQRVSDLDQAARAAGCTVRGFRSEGQQHVTGPVRYESSPPHSGNHNQVPAEDGAYDKAASQENLVHSLEHGRVVVQFRPSVSERVKGQLKSLYDEDPYHLILTPNPRMPYGVAATAWTQVLRCPQANERVFDAIRAFNQRHRDRGPEYVP